MKQVLKYLGASILLILTYVVSTNYPKLNIITGYSAKSTASGMFIAGRTQKSLENRDNNFSPINLATSEVDETTKKVVSTLFGLSEHTAIYREGLGAVVITDDFDENEEFVSPNRILSKNNLPFPYGDLPQKDTIFSNIDYEKLNDIVNSQINNDTARLEGTSSLLVIYKGQIVAEEYAEGFDKSSKLLGWSMTKSIVSTMYGIMQKKGMIDISKPADVEEWQDDERKNITYNNLLQMNSGLEWEEDYNKISDVTEMLYLDRDMSLKQAEKSLEGKPNESWYYASGTSNLLAGMLMKKKFKTQQEYLDFWYTELIDKIGMNSMLVETDLAGNFVGSSYSWANTRDWAKLGLLYMNKGNWNGEQIIDSTWVDYATTATNTSQGQYGAQIWLNTEGFKYPDVPKDLFFFGGYQGQKVYMIPSKDLVVVRMGIDNTVKTDFNKLLKDIVATVE
ncbi:MAG: serine hydrolase [Flavobacteriales bacterium]|nr:serine hydrolase [Flavobacteriales bacterium]